MVMAIVNGPEAEDHSGCHRMKIIGGRKSVTRERTRVAQWVE
jgi:hypothetical protein